MILGVPKLGTEAAFDVSSMYINKSIMGCRYGTSQPRHDVPMLVDYYLSGELLLDQLVTRTYPLDDIERAVHDLEAGELNRGVFQL